MAEEFQLGPAPIENAQALAHLIAGIGKERPETRKRKFGAYFTRLHRSLVRFGSDDALASRLMSSVSSAIAETTSEVLSDNPVRKKPTERPENLTPGGHAHALARHLFWGCRGQSEVGITMRVRAYFREVVQELVNLGEDPSVAIDLILVMAQVRLRQLEEVIRAQSQE